MDKSFFSIDKYRQDNIRAIDARFEAQKIAFAPLTFQAIRALLELGILKEIEKAISGNVEIGDAELAWGVQRTLAHLNEAWHCRRYDITRSTDLGCKMSNLKRWQKYPREFTRLMKGAK